MLVADGVLLSENVAILTYLDAAFPEASLFPRAGNAMQQAQTLSLPVWCASGSHPITTRLRGPQWICDAPGTRARIWEMAAEAMAPNLAIIEWRLSEHAWMLGAGLQVDMTAPKR